MILSGEMAVAYFRFHVPRTARILAATERRGRRGALLLHFLLSRERGGRAVDLGSIVAETYINGLADFYDSVMTEL